MKITDCQKHRLIGQSKNNEIEGFGGRPHVGGMPGARAPRSPLNPALDDNGKNGRKTSRMG